MVFVHISRILSKITLRMIIYLGWLLPATSCSSQSRARAATNMVNSPLPSTARPCTQIRIWPFHLLRYRKSYSQKEFLCFRAGRLCSHLYSFATATGITRYLAPTLPLGVFGLSSLILLLGRSSCLITIQQKIKRGKFTRPTLLRYLWQQHVRR